MELTFYYATNRNHLGKNRFKPQGYGTHPSKDGIENLRFGKVTVDAGVDSLDQWFEMETSAGKGDGGALLNH